MSDGLPERFNQDDEMLDYWQVKNLLIEAAIHSPQEIIQRFVSAGDTWAGSRPQDDDVTFVVLKVK
jgi:serine phosphatase RsbU (regulator of sigma subunit)